MALTFQVPMQYCFLQHWTLLPSPVTSTTGHCFRFGSMSSFFLELFLHSSPVAYGYLLTWGVHLSVHTFLPFILSWRSQGKNAEMVCHSFLQWNRFCQNSPPWPILLGWPYMAWLTVSWSYTRLWSLWSVWLVFCDCDFHSALWCPLATPTILLGFIFPWTWGISSRLL